MLVLQANQEQEQTFHKLIQTMGEPVEWSGRFIVINDELILEGMVRSLVFQFETRQVLTNLYDLTFREEQVLDLARHPALLNLVNMVLYAFGKWGKLRGLRVDQDFPQLNEMFAKIMNAYYIEPSFRKENFRFYKVGVRITYEEVLETALQAELRPEEEPGAEAQGLWHRLIWKNREQVFKKEETTLAQRQEDRIGNNFYLVGYQCPKCSRKLHMAVYPDGLEMRIDTEEKGVYLARVYTCSSCNCFYTPRPQRLISEGLIYEMSFDQDTRAYEDYLELLGRTAERTANFKYNEYEALRNQRLNRERRQAQGQQEDPDILRDEEDALNQMEDFSRRFASLPDAVFRRFAHRVEEGFYPDTAVKKHESKILEQMEQRGMEEDSLPDRGRDARSGQDVKDWLENGIPHAGAALDEGPRYAGTMPAGTGASGLYHGGKADGTQPGRNAGSEPAMAGTRKDSDRMYGAGGGMPQQDGSSEMFRRQNGMAGSYGISRQQNVPADSGAPQPNRGMAGNRTQRQDSSVSWQDDGMAHSVMSGSATDGSRTKAGLENVSADNSAGRQPQMQNSMGNGSTPQRQSANPAAADRIEKYQARLGVLDRLSERQRSDLKKQIRQDASISDYDKRQLLGPIEEAEWKEKTAAIEKKVEGSQNRTYAQIQRVIQDMEKEDLPSDVKQAYVSRLRDIQGQRGAEEVRRIMDKIPKRLDRAGYRDLEQKLHAYEGVDLSPYAETLHKTKEAAEKQEIANIVKRSRKLSREDYVGLMRRLEEQEFADETVAPYMEKIEEKVRSLDEERLNELLDHAQQMDYDAAAQVYEQIEAENFLPELKSNALQMLSRKLEKIRTEECELLVHKLQDDMEGTIKENPRHYFYPARKAMLKTAEPEETRIFDAALSAYAGERSMFEYPIFAADTSRNGSGREGMLLTPETLFYSTRLSAYGIPIASIASVTASTGFLNHKLTLEEANGAEHKLPYAVKNNELEDWAGILEEFVQYLQEKPASRKLNYLAKDTHDTICCFRCGYVYHGRDVCPECGYKKNR